ncbi:hypothetical protein CCYA_CCYA02G0579 [Cyanidiococcus yangmingshanensis]|nr:hypothetical protein CCYA_CCYA02G0579 [Cyanidiococcus yangmingshanensis]
MKHGSWPLAERFALRLPFGSQPVVLRVLDQDNSAVEQSIDWARLNVVYVPPEVVLDRCVSTMAVAVLERDQSVQKLKEALVWQYRERQTAPVLLVECFGPTLYVHDALQWLCGANVASGLDMFRLILRLNASFLWLRALEPSELLDWLVQLLSQPAIRACSTLLVVDDIDLLVEQDAFNGVAQALERLRDITAIPLVLVRQLEGAADLPPVLESLTGEHSVRLELSPPFRSPAEARSFCASVPLPAGHDAEANELGGAFTTTSWSSAVASPAIMLYARPVPWPRGQSASAHLESARPLTLPDQVYVIPGTGWKELHRMIAFMNAWVGHEDIISGSRPTGAVLFGPPGCGKTALLRHIAASAHATRFDFLSTADLSRPVIGESERLLTKLFREERRGSRLRVLVIDEADALFPGRHIPDTGLVRLGGALVEHLDELRHASNRLLVFLATNRPWRLDKSLFFGDKLDSFLYMGPPNAVCRAQVLQSMGLLENLGSKEASLLSQTEGFTFADLASIPERMQRLSKQVFDIVAGMQPSVSREELLHYQRWNAELEAHGVMICEPSSV